MLLTELREAIENGKTAKLFVSKTHEHGIDLTIRVVKRDSQFVWQRGKIEEPTAGLNLKATTRQYEMWDLLMEDLRGTMQLRDNTWEECEELIEGEEKPIEKEEPQLISIAERDELARQHQHAENARIGSLPGSRGE